MTMKDLVADCGQIAMTALRSAAPASGGFGPGRRGRAPTSVMASRWGQHFVHEHVNIGKGIPPPRSIQCSGLDAIQRG